MKISNEYGIINNNVGGNMKTLEFFQQKKDNSESLISYEVKDKYIQMDIVDNISMQEYFMAINRYSPDKRDVFTFNVLWNGDIQKINKGTYFAFQCNNRYYNILIGDKVFKIDEKTPMDKGSVSKVFTGFENGEYELYKCMHDEYGSSHEVSCFSSTGKEFLARKIERQEFEIDCKSMIDNVEKFDGIQEINSIYDFLTYGKDAIRDSFNM